MTVHVKIIHLNLFHFSKASIMAIESPSADLTFNKFITVMFRDRINELVIAPIFLLVLVFYAYIIQDLLLNIVKLFKKKDQRLDEIEDEILKLKELVDNQSESVVTSSGIISRRYSTSNDQRQSAHNFYTIVCLNDYVTAEYNNKYALQN